MNFVIIYLGENVWKINIISVHLLEVDTIDGVTFIWFTDGGGWKKAKNNLEETFDVNQNIFNINDLENGIMDTIIKGKL